MLAQLLLVLAFTTGMQAPEIPAPVVTAFAAQFPGTRVKKWEERKEGYWAAEPIKSLVYFLAPKRAFSLADEGSRYYICYIQYQ
jgi:hypothetical protein